MDRYQRASIEEHLAAALAPGDDSGARGKVGALSSLRAVAVSLDQVVNRALADHDRWGTVDPSTHAVNAQDFAVVRRHLRILELGLETGRRMLAHVESQLGLKAAPEKPTKVAAAGRRGPEEK